MRKNKCPFLEEVVVRYCNAYPIKKMLPTNALYREEPCIGCPQSCAIYQEVAIFNHKEKSKDVSFEFSCDKEQQETIRGFSFLAALFYLPNHIWLSVEHNRQVKIGFDDFACKILNKIKTIEIVTDHEVINELRVKQNGNTIKIPLYIKGRISQLNNEVLANPNTIKQNPYAYWLASIESDALGESLQKTKQGDTARQWFMQDVEKLQEMLHQECGITLADGGEIFADWAERISDSVMQKVINKFLTKNIIKEE